MDYFAALVSFLGFFIIFGLGCILTAKLLKAIVYGKYGRRSKERGTYSRRNIEALIFLGGGITAVLYEILLKYLPPWDAVLLLGPLLIYGFYSIITWFLASRKRTASSKIPVPPITKATNYTEPIESLNSKLDELTRSLNWDWGTFRSILICLARMGAGHYIPANKRPNSISVSGLQSTFNELREISATSHSRETSRAILVDSERSCLVISGKTHIGTPVHVKIDLETQPGRDRVQLPILTIHVHPSEGNSKGLSDIDYISFLSDTREIVMMICYQDVLLFAMKTSVTSTAIQAATAQKRISTIKNDILKIWSNLFLPDSIVAFNKAVCMEFGMTLYQTKGQNQNIAHRIEVTNL